MKQVGRQAGIKPRRIGDDALAVLQAHNWPGNVRQLRNNIERLMILVRGDDVEQPITADLLPAEIGDVMPRAPSQSDQHIMALPLREAREMFEKEYLIAQINRFGGNISRTAEFIGMERSALHRKLKSLGV
jgi:two-component system nitrogen regulation response regulator NtrX